MEKYKVNCEWIDSKWATSKNVPGIYIDVLCFMKKSGNAEIDFLAKKLDVNRKIVGKALDHLISVGVISRQKNEYTICQEKFVTICAAFFESNWHQNILGYHRQAKFL